MLLIFQANVVISFRETGVSCSVKNQFDLFKAHSTFLAAFRSCSFIISNAPFNW